MMIYIEILILICVVALFIKGLHRVTRPDKILSFLGVYISEEYGLSEVQNATEIRLIDCQTDFFVELAALRSDAAICELVVNYKKAAETAIEMDDYAGIQEIVNAKRSRLGWRIIEPFANCLTECEICMSSFWGALFFALHYSGAFSFTCFGVPVLLAFIFPLLIAGFVSLINND